MTQDDLGELLDVRGAQIGHWEAGRRYIKPDQLCILRDVFALNQADFVALCEWAAQMARELRQARREAA